MSTIKRLGLICLLVAGAAIALAQCGGGTSTTTGPVSTADGGTSSTGTPGPTGW